MGLITSDINFDSLIIITFITLAIYVYVQRKFDYWKKRGIKEIPPTFFFGNIAPCIFTKQNPQEFLTDIYRKSEGEKFIGFHVFNKPYLLIRDPELIRHIFIKDFNNFTNRLISGNHYDDLGSKSLFLVSNPPWKNIRQKLSPVFTSGKLKRMFYLMLEVCEDLQTHIENRGVDEKHGTPIDIKELLAQFTTDLIGTTAFGLKFNSLSNPNSEFRKYGKQMFRGGFKRYLELLAIFFVPDLRFLTRPKFFDKEGTEYFRNSFWSVINERMKTGIKRNDVIDLLIDLKKEQDNDTDDSFKLEGDTLVAQASNFFAAGFETSSTTMTFALYELAKNPEMQRKLRDEILGAMEETDGKLTYDMVTSLSYLNMVIHETLRIYPVLPWLDRVADNDYTIPGTDITISKGTICILPMRPMHMDPKYYPDPKIFDPERFSEENKKSHTPFTYYPFGEGPRNCIGARLGLLQAKLGLVQSILKFDVTTCEETSIPIKLDKMNVLIHAAGKVMLNFRKI